MNARTEAPVTTTRAFPVKIDGVLVTVPANYDTTAWTEVYLSDNFLRIMFEGREITVAANYVRFL